MRRAQSAAEGAQAMARAPSWDWILVLTPESQRNPVPAPIGRVDPRPSTKCKWSFRGWCAHHKTLELWYSHWLKVSP